ncbi:hypothetical protein QTP88_023817 [Uroleucon formosanum]
MFQKSAVLEILAEKSSSPAVKEAIQELLAVVEELNEKRNCVVRAFNPTLISTAELEAEGEETRRCYKCKTVGHLVASCTLPRHAEMSEGSDPGQRIEVNLNHCWMAQQLLLQTVAELDIDVVIVSDYNRPLGQAPRWVASVDSKCAVYVPGRFSITVTDQGFGDGFAWARVGGKLFYSFYYTPNCTIQEFDLFLSGLETSVQQVARAGSDIIIAGDFNSHSANGAPQRTTSEDPYCPASPLHST